MNKLSSVPRPTFSQIVTFLIACGAIFLLVGLSQRWLITRDELARKRAVKESLAAVQAERDDLREKMTEAEINAALGRAAQEDLGWVAEGEHAVLFVYPEELLRSEPAPRPAADVQSPPYWLEWAQQFQ